MIPIHFYHLNYFFLFYYITICVASEKKKAKKKKKKAECQRSKAMPFIASHHTLAVKEERCLVLLNQAHEANNHLNRAHVDQVRIEVVSETTEKRLSTSFKQDLHMQYSPLCFHVM